MATLHTMRAMLGSPIYDQQDELYALYGRPLTSALGIVRPTAPELSLIIGSHALTIHQSPTMLQSSLPGGTTGAVLWEVTPKLAAWLISDESILQKLGVLTNESTILELGCGSTGVLACTVGRQVKEWICSDMGYVMKILRRNLEENLSAPQIQSPPASEGRAKSRKAKKGAVVMKEVEDQVNNVTVVELDWSVHSLTASSMPPSSPMHHLDAVIACDCVYNPALLKPFVQTCKDACALSNEADENEGKRTVCIIAQQLRASDIFETWLNEFMMYFWVWRLGDDALTDNLKVDKGFCIHLGILKHHHDQSE